MINPFNLVASPDFSHFFCDTTPEQPSVKPRSCTPMEQSFCIDQDEQRLNNPVEIQFSSDVSPFSTPTELKMYRQERCEIFFQNRIPTPPTKRTSLPLLTPSPTPGTLNANVSYRDTKMVTNSSWIDLSRKMNETSIRRDSVMMTKTSFLSSEYLNCDMRFGTKCPSESPKGSDFTPDDKLKTILSSPTPILVSGSRVSVSKYSRNKPNIRQRLEWDYSPFQIGKIRHESRGIFKKSRAVKPAKVNLRFRLGELDPNVQRGISKNNGAILNKNRMFERI